MLLAGAVRRPTLAAAAGRAIVDLPLDGRRSLLDAWQAGLATMADALALESVRVRLVLDRHSRAPRTPEADPRVDLAVERDAREFRGTAGVLRDLTRQYDPDDYVLVANAAQVLMEPLDQLAVRLATPRADASLIAHADGTPGGLILLRCGALEQVSDVGYCDLKEQVLPRIARTHEVHVLKRLTPTGLPIRSGHEYIRVLSRYHRASQRPRPGPAGIVEEGRSSFAIVEPGARVESGVRLHDSVVLNGATVRARSFVARSVVCGSGVVRKNRTVFNELVSCRF